MRKLFLFFSLLSAFMIIRNGFKPFPTITLADTQTPAPRHAACDLCGYCPPNPAPSSWGDCVNCLYGLPKNTSPDAGVTLNIDDNTNLPPEPTPGKQYTMLGCIGGFGGFAQSGGQASVIQVVLNIIFSIVGGVALLSLIYGAFVIMTSQSNPERLNYGKRIVYGAIIGTIFTAFSVFLINFLATGILKIPGFGQ